MLTCISHDCYYLCCDIHFKMKLQYQALPGYMDKAVYNVVMYYSTEMWLHFRNVATNLIGRICSHISVEKCIMTL